MKVSIGLNMVLAILLTTLALAGSAESNTPSSKEKTLASSSQTTKQDSSSYSGYSVDGRTSASVIAAKRSHTVSSADETGLAIYSGLFVIGLIVFFSHILSKK